MRSRQCLMLAALCALALPPMSVQAIVIRGTFSGTAQAEGLPLPFEPPRPVSYYDGAPVTGSFTADFRDPYFQVGGDDYAYYFNGSGGTLTLNYDIKDAHFRFVDAESSILLLSSSASGQSVSFMSNIMPKYDGGSFTISGPVGSLFDGLAPATLHIDPDAAYVFSTGFASGTANMRIGVDLAQVDFAPSTPVPEPATALLLGLGGSLLGWRLRKR